MYADKKGYLVYQRLICLNIKIRKLSDNFKNTYVITVGTKHPPCAEPPDPIVKCANFNIGTIKNCTSVYKIQLYTIRSDLIIGMIPFPFIKEARSSDPIYYLLCCRRALYFDSLPRILNP